ncbi:hypothetical protein B0H19DRAFT_1079467 [Mycena capillaripes]|nr:hypothetical protein B0H19DRAFT_1079467 [Mycena capillaripes]
MKKRAEIFITHLAPALCMHLLSDTHGYPQADLAGDSVGADIGWMHVTDALLSTWAKTSGNPLHRTSSKLQVLTECIAKNLDAVGLIRNVMFVVPLAIVFDLESESRGEPKHGFEGANPKSLPKVDLQSCLKLGGRTSGRLRRQDMREEVKRRSRFDAYTKIPPRYNGFQTEAIFDALAVYTPPSEIQELRKHREEVRTAHIKRHSVPDPDMLPLNLLPEVASTWLEVATRHEETVHAYGPVLTSFPVLDIPVPKISETSPKNEVTGCCSQNYVDVALM